MNTHESYVSLETAKLLKKAGFDWEGTSYYQHGVFYPYSIDRERLVVMNQSSAPSYMEQYSAPTLEVVQRWLREVKGILVFCTAYRENLQNPFDKWEWDLVLVKGGRIAHDSNCNTYEQAQEAGINKCLTILLEEKQ